MTDWTLCGWRVRSDIPLPEALPWTGDPDRGVDVTVRLGEVPESLPDACHTEPVASVAPDGTYLFQLRRAARYLVRAGREIVIAPIAAADSPDVRLFVETNCLSALVLQRGLLAMHGSVVRVRGRTVAILGGSGQGKSTLAALLAARGHRFLAEDVCALDTGNRPGARPAVIPSLPNIRLWRDALDTLGMDAAPLVRSRAHLEKYHLVRPDWFHDRPETLDAVVLLRRATPATAPEGLAPGRGFAPVQMVGKQVLRPKLAEVLGCEGRVISTALTLAREGRVFLLNVVRDMERLAEGADRIEELCGDLPP